MSAQFYVFVLFFLGKEKTSPTSGSSRPYNRTTNQLSVAAHMSTIIVPKEEQAAYALKRYKIGDLSVLPADWHPPNIRWNCSSISVLVTAIAGSLLH